MAIFSRQQTASTLTRGGLFEILDKKLQPCQKLVLKYSNIELEFPKKITDKQWQKISFISLTLHTEHMLQATNDKITSLSLPPSLCYWTYFPFLSTSSAFLLFTHPLSCLCSLNPIFPLPPGPIIHQHSFPPQSLFSLPLLLLQINICWLACYSNNLLHPVRKHWHTETISVFTCTIIFHLYSIKTEPWI